MLVEYQKKGQIAIITLNQPEKLNAISPEMAGQFSSALADFRSDEQLRVSIITGIGEKAFCAGANIETTIPFLKRNRGEVWRMPPTIMRGLDLWKPIIAAINGVCLGAGLEIALACDIRIAAENATFGVPEVRLGLIPGWGGTQRLPRIIPWPKAIEMVFTGRIIDVHEAYKIGLVNKVVASAEMMSEAEKMAEALCEVAPLAVRAAKQAMVEGTSVGLEEGLQIEAMLMDFCLSTKDCEEGVKAYVEKRKPSFRGK